MTRLRTNSSLAMASNRARGGAQSRTGPILPSLKKPGVTLLILWEEYRGSHPDGYGYSRFCELFRSFEQRLSPTMRQEHAAGDKVFVDYSGKKIPIADRDTGEIREAEVFMAVLGASSFAYAEATWTQTLPDWIGSHVRMFRFFDGVPRLIVPDYVPGHVIALLFPARLCAPQPVDPSVLNDIEAHNDQRPASHSRSFGSLCQTGFRGGPTEEVEGT